MLLIYLSGRASKCMYVDLILFHLGVLCQEFFKV